MSLSRERRSATLKRAPSWVCGAKECAASTVAARQSKLCSRLLDVVASKPAPFFNAPPSRRSFSAASDNADNFTPPQAAKDPGSMPEPSNEGPAKSDKKRGRGACAPANRRPFRTLDGTKQAKASAGEFLVLFAAKKYITSRGRNPRLVADQKAAIPLRLQRSFGTFAVKNSG